MRWPGQHNLNWGKNWSLIANRMSTDWLQTFNISCGRGHLNILSTFNMDSKQNYLKSDLVFISSYPIISIYLNKDILRCLSGKFLYFVWWQICGQVGGDGKMERWWRQVINVWYCDASNVCNVPLYSQEDLFNVFWSSVFTGHNLYYYCLLLTEKSILPH